MCAFLHAYKGFLAYLYTFVISTCMSITNILLEYVHEAMWHVQYTFCIWRHVYLTKLFCVLVLHRLTDTLDQ